jgi:hypothetical protein
MLRYVLDPDTNLPLVLPSQYKYKGFTYTDLYDASDEFLMSIGLTPIPPRPTDVNPELIEWDQTTNQWVVNNDPAYYESICELRCDACVTVLSGIILENITFANSVPSNESLITSVLEVNSEMQATISGLKSGFYTCDNYPAPRTVSYNGVYLPV